MSEISFKIFVQRKHDVSIHRFRGAFDFDGLKTVVGHLFNSSSPNSAKKMVIEYDDDEGDRVRVASDIEWKECLRLRSTSTDVMKLYVRKGKLSEGRVAKSGKEEANSDSDAEEPTSEQPSATKQQTPVVPKLQGIEALLFSHLNRSGSAQMEEEEKKQEAREQSQQPNYQCESAFDKVVLDLISRLFRCDAAHELMNPLPAVDFGSCIKRVVDPFCGEVHIDINRETLRSRAICTANAMLDAKQLEAAEAVLTMTNDLFPGDPVITYNLACAYALQGNTELALFHLENSIANGYKKVEHAESDTDLDSIKGTPKFRELLALMKGEQPAPAPVTPTPVVVTPPVVVAEVVAPVAPVLPVDPNVLNIQAIFPQKTVEEIQELLKKHGNRVDAVVNRLLEIA